MLLELRIHERSKEINGLLTYEHAIDNDDPPLLTHARTSSRPRPSELHPETFREKGECCCEELREELVEQEELGLLIKEKN